MRSLRQGEVWILAFAVTLGAAVRLASLDHQSFDHDEAVTAGRVLAPGIRDTLEVVRDGERSPPLYYLVAWLWSKPFGTGEIGLRSLTALIGGLTVPVAWWAGRELASPRAGLLAAAFVAVNPCLVWYSQEARSYSLLVLLTAIAIAALACALRRSETRGIWIWTGASALALCSHYFAVFVVAPQAALLLARSGRARARAATASAIVVLAGVALLPLALAQEGGDRRNAFSERPVAGRLGESLIQTAAGVEPRPFAGDARVDALQASMGMSLGAALVGAIAILVHFGSTRERGAALVSAMVVASALLVPAALALMDVDFLNPRNVIGAVVPLLLLLAVGLGSKRAPRSALAAAGIWCLLCLGVIVATQVSPQMQRPDWRSVAELIGPAETTRVVVTNANGDDPLLLYLDRARRFGARSGPQAIQACEMVIVSTNLRVGSPDGFRLVERQSLPPWFHVWRHLSPSPRPIDLSVALDESVVSERSAALVQRRARRSCDED